MQSNSIQTKGWYQSRVIFTENITRNFLQWNCCIELFNVVELYFCFGNLNNQNINLADRKDCVDGYTAKNIPVKMQLLVLAIMLQKGELVLCLHFWCLHSYEGDNLLNKVQNLLISSELCSVNCLPRTRIRGDLFIET